MALLLGKLPGDHLASNPRGIGCYFPPNKSGLDVADLRIRGVNTTSISNSS